MARLARVAIAGAVVLSLCLLPVSGSAGRIRAARAGARAVSGLTYSNASNTVVQAQPPWGSCRAIGSGVYSRPDPRCTPGALNPAVRQASIEQTICRSGWTRTVRPREAITEQEKRLSLAAYGDRGAISGYEYDHFVPLELGGATNDRRNLWPEPGATPNPKDAVEDYLNRQVCLRKMTLANARRAIAANWVAVYQRLHRPSSPKPSAPPAPSATCSANAQWSSAYSDYDVYVHSNQPDDKVTVSGAGTSASWYTDRSGYADVYFHAGRSAAGDQVTIRVGAATCHATL